MVLRCVFHRTNRIKGETPKESRAGLNAVPDGGLGRF